MGHYQFKDLQYRGGTNSAKKNTAIMKQSQHRCHLNIEGIVIVVVKDFGANSQFDSERGELEDLTVGV